MSTTTLRPMATTCCSTFGFCTTILSLKSRGSKGPAVQQPVRSPMEFDHVFTTAFDTYVELDRRNLQESIRLNILQDYLPGRYFDTARMDHAGYVVSGILDSDPHGSGCWTTRFSKLKFDLYPHGFEANADVPRAGRHCQRDRHLSLIVDGETVGSIALTQPGEKTAEFPVRARAITPAGFTILELKGESPYRPDGQGYGVVLARAEFDCQK